MKSIYCAGPFFTSDQVKTIEVMENAIETAGFRLISPRRSGVLLNMSAEDRRKSAKSIFITNCRDIKDCDYLLALIDDRDTGTIWEMGYCYGIGQRPIFTYTEKDYGINVMLQGCIDGHAKGAIQLRKMLAMIALGEDLSEFAPNMEKTY